MFQTLVFPNKSQNIFLRKIKKIDQICKKSKLIKFQIEKIVILPQKNYQKELN